MVQLSNKESCPHCSRFANRGVTIDAIIVKDSEILLVKRGRDPFKGFWALPGGYVDWDETVENAVAREVREETSLLVKNLKLLKIYSNPARHPKQCIDLAFVVEAEGVPKHGDDAQELLWVSLERLPKTLAFDHKQIIEDYLALISK
jgi:ADP-ribose pyrophosphatase YjhB (NUDIX family)